MEIVTTDILKRELTLTEDKLRVEFVRFETNLWGQFDTRFKKELDRTENKLSVGLRIEMDERFSVLEKSLKQTINDAMAKTNNDLQNLYVRYTGLLKVDLRDYFKAATELTIQNTRDIKIINNRLDEDIEPRLNRVVFQLRTA